MLKITVEDTEVYKIFGINSYSCVNGLLSALLSFFEEECGLSGALEVWRRCCDCRRYGNCDRYLGTVYDNKCRNWAAKNADEPDDDDCYPKGITYALK